MKISPSILACDFSILKTEIDSVFGAFDYLHIDVMDGHFVPNITFGPALVKDIRKHYDIVFDVHLMISKPLDYIEAFSNAGSDIITFHLECENDTLETIKKIKSFGRKAGLSIKPKTDVKKIIEYLKLVDLVLVMSVEPGFGGQKFDESSVDKIKFLSDYKKSHGLTFEIEVDGGINEQTISLVKEAGCDIVVAGSYVFNSSDRIGKINSLKK